MDIQTLTKAAAITQGVMVGTMVGLVTYCNVKQRQMNRTMADIDAQIEYGNNLMKNWHKMPPR